MHRVFGRYASVVVDGDVKYAARVEECLKAISALPDGPRFFQALCSTPHRVTIKDTTGGNSCSPGGDGVNPVLILAMVRKQQGVFQDEMLTALNRAVQRGLTVEHIARQLAVGLTPATYRASQNVVHRGLSFSWWERNITGVKKIMDKRIAANAEALLQLASGELPVTAIPDTWKNELPRVLRNHLTPGPGASPTVNFNPLGLKHCPHNPAMHGRPPAIGLAHELIHALHGMQGVNQRFNCIGGEKLEEVITTGMPPYNFEEFSDNKFRAQWPARLHLREQY